MTDCPGWIFKKHDFDKWEIIRQGDIYTSSPFERKEYFTGFWIKQQRICKNCGCVQIRIAKSTN